MKCESRDAEKARTLYCAIDMPSYLKMIKLLETNYIRDFLVTFDNVKHAQYIQS